MAAARPFVSTAAGGVVDMVTGCAEGAGEGARWYANGVLADPDAKALAGALTALARNRSLVSRMGLEAQAFASRQYRKERLVADLDELYSELLETRRKA